MFQLPEELVCQLLEYVRTPVLLKLRLVDKSTKEIVTRFLEVHRPLIRSEYVPMDREEWISLPDKIKKWSLSPSFLKIKLTLSISFDGFSEQISLSNTQARTDCLCAARRAVDVFCIDLEDVSNRTIQVLQSAFRDNNAMPDAISVDQCPWLDNSTITLFKQGKCLSLEDCPNVCDLSCLAESMESLSIRECPLVGTGKIIACHKLWSLRLVSQACGDNLWSLQTLTSLTNLVFEKCYQLSDLSVLTMLPKLQSVTLIECRAVENFAPLGLVANVHVEDCQHFDAVFHVDANTKTLKIIDCPKVQSLSRLPSSLTGLELDHHILRFNLKDKNIADISSLRDCACSLSTFVWQHMPANPIGLEVLAQVSNLHLAGNWEVDLSSDLVFCQLVSLRVQFPNILWKKVGHKQYHLNSDVAMFPKLRFVEIDYGRYQFEEIYKEDIVMFKIPNAKSIVLRIDSNSMYLCFDEDDPNNSLAWKQYTT